MAELIAVFGESGSGKTTSIRNLNPAETFLITTSGKRPGIAGAKKKYIDFNPSAKTKVELGNFRTITSSESTVAMLKTINTKMPWIKYIILDDFQYFMAFEAMTRAKETGYGKFTEMAQHAFDIIKAAMDLRDDLYVVISVHSENLGDRVTPYHKIKTMGKMLDSVITLEGLFTYVFFTCVNKDEDGNSLYQFQTNSNGTCTAKSPMGLFNTLYIDNDLKAVIERIEQYNNED